MKRSEALLATAAAVALPALARGQGTPRIRVAGLAGEATAEGYYAEKGSFFRRAGLDADLQTLSNGGAVTAAVVGGAADVGVTNVGSMAAAHSRGVPLVLVAPSAVADAAHPATVVAVRADGPLRAPRDLAGKTLCVSTLRDLQQAAVMQWLEKSGVNPNVVHFVEIPIPDQLLALRAGRIDAAVLVEPFITEGARDVRAIGAPYAALGNRIMTHGWVANRAWYERNRPVAAQFIAAMRSTARWANGHPADTAALLAAISRIPRDVIVRMNRLSFGETLEPAQIQPIIDVTARYGFLQHPFPASELIA